MEERFGEVARQARVKARMSLRQLAEQLGWTPVYVSEIERGTRNPPAVSKAWDWAQALGVDPERFVRLALRSRGSLELPIDDDDALAYALARKWGSLTAEQRTQVLHILEEDD